MDYTAAERMQKLRDKRKSSGLVEFKLWVKKELLEEVRDIFKSLENYSLDDERNEGIKNLKEKLHRKLSENKNWETYYEKHYQMPTSKNIGFKSTEKQRKFAYVICRAVGITLPNNFTLANKILLAEWIKKQIQAHQLHHIYEWEEIAKEYRFDS